MADDDMFLISFKKGEILGELCSSFSRAHLWSDATGVKSIAMPILLSIKNLKSSRYSKPSLSEKMKFDASSSIISNIVEVSYFLS